MREGYWINYQTGKVIEIDDHERWLKINPANPKKLGVPANVMGLARGITDREKFLMFVMQHAPIMRVRGHGTSVTFEFYSRDRQEVMDAIWIWGKQNAGPFMWLNISNLATHENTQMNYNDFEKSMDSGGVEAVLRVAGATDQIVADDAIIGELQDISRLLEVTG